MLDNDSPAARGLRIAVDIGGTFTDLAAFDEGGAALRFGKALSTHDHLVTGIQHTMDWAGVQFSDAYLFLHGSTIAINTLLERTGANTALLVTEGFRDVYEIGRVNRPDAYNLFFSKHTPLIERALRFEVPERMRADGEQIKPLDESRVRDIARDLRRRGIESVAVLLIHSYRNPANESRVKQIVQNELPNAFVSASHELSQEYREFERVSTTAANAYIGPRVASYLGELEDHLETEGFGGSFFAVQSTGGLFPVEHAKKYCVRMLESGPAAGVVGAQALARQLELDDVIAFDMGGTTAKAGVIHDGKPLTTGSALIGGYDKGKLEEMAHLLKPFGVSVIGAAEMDLPEPEETEDTFVGNARIKAHAAAKATGLPALSDDSGITINALDGAPGVYTADWAETGNGRDFMMAMTRAHDELEAKNAPHPRTAQFRCTLVLAWPDGHDEVFEGAMPGRIVWPMRGDLGHGYDPIFQPDGETRTFGEMPRDEKNAISHRADAFRKLSAIFDNE